MTNLTVIMNYGNSDIVFRRLKKYTRSREERMMKISIYTHRALGMAGVVALVAGIILTGLATIAGAADNSNTSNHLTFYTNDGQVKSSMEDYGDWFNFEMAFFKGSIYKMFYKLDVSWEHDCIAYYSHGVDETPPESPDLTLLEFCDPPILNSSVNWTCDQQIAGLRLCVFNGRLYVFYLKADAYFTSGSTWRLCYKYYDDTLDVWSEQVVLWSFNLKVPDVQSPPLGGLVVKVMNGLVYLLVQAGSRPLYAFQFDRAGLVNYDPNHLVSFNLESSSDLLLNGDVLLKITDDPNDHREFIAFVTKDDGTNKPAGACKLYVYDPAEGTSGSVAKVANIPNGPNGKGWKDLAVAQGNVDLCEPYSVNALQIWGFPWDDKQLHHTQFVFNDDGKTGSFNLSGWVDLTKVWSSAENSKSYKNYNRGLMAAGAFPSQGTESDGTAVLSMHTWVWWYGKNSGLMAHNHGRSIRYLGDYLRLENPVQTDTSVEKDPNEAWILLGIITALPPYYPNSADPSELEDFLMVQYGLSSTQEISSSVTTENSFSFGYSKNKILKSAGVGGEFGISYSHAVQHTQKQTSTVTTKTQQTFSPIYSDWTTYPNGQEAWALFLAPNISNDPYQVYAPPEAYAASHPNDANNLEFTVYYVYTNGSSLRAYSFDITNPSANPFFKGLTSMPSAYDYKGWSNAAYQRQTTTTDYEILTTTGISAPGSKTTWEIDYDNSIENLKGITNTMSVNAGAFGFNASMSGSIKSSSSVSTTIGTSFAITYDIYTLYDNDPSKYADWNLFLDDIGFDAYLLNAKTSDAFFIPDSCRTTGSMQYPWCLTWYVSYYDNKGGESKERAVKISGGGSSGCFIMSLIE